jgi:hypothetical protein
MVKFMIAAECPVQIGFLHGLPFGLGEENGKAGYQIRRPCVICADLYY